MKRVLTALLLIPAIVVVNFSAPRFLVWAVLIAVSLLALRELFSLIERLGFRPYRIAAYGAGTLLIAAPGAPETALIIGFSLILLALSFQRSEPLSGAFGAASSTLFCVVYVCGPFLLARRLHELSPYWLFFVLLINWTGDSAAFYAGRAFGKHKLARRISPHKTWEGTFASMLVAAPAGAGYLMYFKPDPPVLLVCLLLAAMVNIAAQLGDLAESVLKREAEVKDSGRLLPGHGGMLDRVDGMLFSLPACYFLLRLFG